MPNYLLKWMKNKSRRKNTGVMEHSELVQEMWRGEWMSTGERLSLARRRRQAQLRAWTNRETELAKLPPQPLPQASIVFTDSVVLLEAASRNDIDEVRKLLMKGVSPDSTNEDGLTALHQCCIDDNEDMMRLLLEFGANVNAEDSEKWTPLHAAATCGHLHLVRHLIDNGAELLAVNSDGNMPYDICEDEASLEAIEGEMARRGVTQQLIDQTRQAIESRMLADLTQTAAKGGDLEYRDHQNATPLHIAAANGYLRVVEFLLDHHVSTDVKDLDDWQPLHAAACWGHLDVVEVLVQQGADLNARTRLDETPLDMAEDPELRQRIEDLWREQERRKERRSLTSRANSNTRVRSVRRTSVRDRGLTAKRDAAIEAKSLRLLQGSDVSLKDIAVRDGEDRREPEGKDSDSIVQQESPRTTTSGSLEVPAEASYSEESNGKINIHVSVTINAGTLAELKRARQMSRVSSPDNSSGSITSSNSLHNSTDSPKKFIGSTSENMVGDAKATRCCTIL